MESKTVFLTILVLSGLAFTGGCQQEVRRLEPPEIAGAEAPDTTLVALAKVYHEGRHIGWLRTYRYEGTNGRNVTWVQDLKDNSLGYVTDEGLAYRNTAHKGHELVANTTRLRTNVAAVFGMPMARVELETLESAR